MAEALFFDNASAVFIRFYLKAEARANGFRGEKLVFRPEAVYIYSERKETRVE